MANYNTLPSTATGKIEPFTIHIEEQQLQDFKTLVRLSPIVKNTYENQKGRVEEGGYWAVTREWLVEAKRYWENEFDWREREAHLNSFPQFKAEIVDDDGAVYSVHFAALFSRKKDAVPPAPPLDRDWTYADSSRILHKLMLALGFGERGYVVSGGDIGSGLGRMMAVAYPEVKAFHSNHNHMPAPDDATDEELQDFEREEGIPRFEAFVDKATAYRRVQGTRPATLSAVLASSPIALLAWVGENYLERADPKCPIPLAKILEEVCLYWFTGCSATTLYPYREDFMHGIYKKGYLHGQEHLFVDKPFGYSYFPKEIAPIPKSWAERTGKLVWYRRHESGGHYAALESGEVLLGDLEDFVGEVWR